MGIYDRDYTKSYYHPPQRRVNISLPVPGTVVKRLLIINIAVFVVTALLRPVAGFCIQWFSVYPASAFFDLQVWRYVSYQFLHGGFGHIFGNMLGLYFFGPMLESRWGSKTFLWFYLICGAAGGLLYTLLVSVGFLEPYPMIGASGALFAILAACAIYYPRATVLVFGIFPMPLGVLVAIYAFYSFTTVISRGLNAGGEAAHLAGAAAGAVYVLWKPAVDRILVSIITRRQQKKQQQIYELQMEIDRILEKVHQQGIGSLSRKEKKILREATEAEQEGRL